MKKSKLSGIITTPTDDRRHTFKVRYGKVSSEYYAKDPERRKELGLPPKYVEE